MGSFFCSNLFTLMASKFLMKIELACQAERGQSLIVAQLLQK